MFYTNSFAFVATWAMWLSSGRICTVVCVPVLSNWNRRGVTGAKGRNRVASWSHPRPCRLWPGHAKKCQICMQDSQLHGNLDPVYGTFSIWRLKHCQRHNGPEGWVLLTKETSSYTNLDQIPKFKIFRPNFNIKILTKHSLHNLTKPQQQNTDQTSVSKVSLELQLQTLGQTLCSKSEQNLALWPNFSFQNCIKLSSNLSHHQHQQQ